MMTPLVLLVLGACPTGQQVVDAAGHCCWQGQVFVAEQARCRGVATCPPGTTFDSASEACFGRAEEWAPAPVPSATPAPPALPPGAPAAVSPMPAPLPPPPIVEAPLPAAPPAYAPPAYAQPPPAAPPAAAPPAYAQPPPAAPPAYAQPPPAAPPAYAQPPPAAPPAYAQPLPAAPPAYAQPPPAAAPVAQPEPQPVPQQLQCPPGSVWSGAANQCLLPSNAPVVQQPPSQCPQGTTWDQSAGRCYVDATPPPGPAASPPAAAANVRRKDARTAEEDRYLRFRPFDFHFTITFDFGSLMEGLELVPQITFLRGARGRMGLFIGGGVMTTLFGAPRKQTVLYAPAGLFGAVRFGHSTVELQFRGGGVFGAIWALGTSAPVTKLMGGMSLFIASGPRGSGVDFGLDLMGIQGFVALARVGYVF